MSIDSGEKDTNLNLLLSALIEEQIKTNELLQEFVGLKPNPQKTKEPSAILSDENLIREVTSLLKENKNTPLSQIRESIGSQEKTASKPEPLPAFTTSEVNNFTIDQVLSEIKQMSGTSVSIRDILDKISQSVEKIEGEILPKTNLGENLKTQTTSTPTESLAVVPQHLIAVRDLTEEESENDDPRPKRNQKASNESDSTRFDKFNIRLEELVKSLQKTTNSINSLVDHLKTKDSDSTEEESLREKKTESVRERDKKKKSSSSSTEREDDGMGEYLYYKPRKGKKLEREKFDESAHIVEDPDTGEEIDERELHHQRRRKMHRAYGAAEGLVNKFVGKGKLFGEGKIATGAGNLFKNITGDVSTKAYDWLHSWGWDQRELNPLFVRNNKKKKTEEPSVVPDSSELAIRPEPPTDTSVFSEVLPPEHPIVPGSKRHKLDNTVIDIDAEVVSSKEKSISKLYNSTIDLTPSRVQLPSSLSLPGTSSPVLTTTSSTPTTGNLPSIDGDKELMANLIKVMFGAMFKNYQTLTSPNFQSENTSNLNQTNNKVLELAAPTTPESSSSKEAAALGETEQAMALEKQQEEDKKFELEQEKAVLIKDYIKSDEDFTESVLRPGWALMMEMLHAGKEGKGGLFGGPGAGEGPSMEPSGGSSIWQDLAEVTGISWLGKKYKDWRDKRKAAKEATSQPHAEETHAKTSQPHAEETHAKTSQPHAEETHAKTSQPHAENTHVDVTKPATGAHVDVTKPATGAHVESHAPHSSNNLPTKTGGKGKAILAGLVGMWAVNKLFGSEAHAAEPEQKLESANEKIETSQSQEPTSLTKTVKDAVIQGTQEGAVAGLIEHTLTKLLGASDALANVATKTAGVVASEGTSWWSKLASKGTELVAGARGMVESASNTASGAWTSIKNTSQNVLKAGQNVALDTLESAKGIGAKSLAAIEDVGSSALTQIERGATNVATGLKTAGGAIAETTSGAFSTAKNWTKGLVKGGGNLIAKVGGKAFVLLDAAIQGYSFYNDWKDINEQLENGKITEQEADEEKTKLLIRTGFRVAGQIAGTVAGGAITAAETFATGGAGIVAGAAIMGATTYAGSEAGGWAGDKLIEKLYGKKDEKKVDPKEIPSESVPGIEPQNNLISTSNLTQTNKELKKEPKAKIEVSDSTDKYPLTFAASSNVESTKEVDSHKPVIDRLQDQEARDAASSSVVAYDGSNTTNDNSVTNNNHSVVVNSMDSRFAGAYANLSDKFHPVGFSSRALSF